MWRLIRLIDFFRYFSHEFQYNNTVISIRAGHLTKESKGWMNDVSGADGHFSGSLADPVLLIQIDVGGINENARDRNRLCIEVSEVISQLSSESAKVGRMIGSVRDAV